MNKIVLVAILLLVAGSGIYAVSRSQSAAPENMETNQTQATGEQAGVPDGTDETTTARERTIQVEAGSFYFKPNELRVKKGEKVTLVLNSVSMMHNFVVDELNINVPITKNGESATIEFTPDKAGEFEFYCAVGNHRQQGQVGKLIVEE